MSLVNRLNRRLAARLRRGEPRVVVADDAVRLIAPDGGERRLPLADLSSAAVLHRDLYAADAVLLRLSWPSGEVAEIFQDDPQWPAAVAALDRLGRTAEPSATWQLRALADGPDARPRELLSPSPGGGG